MPDNPRIFLGNQQHGRPPSSSLIPLRHDSRGSRARTPRDATFLRNPPKWRTAHSPCFLHTGGRGLPIAWGLLIHSAVNGAKVLILGVTAHRAHFLIRREPRPTPSRARLRHMGLLGALLRRVSRHASRHLPGDHSPLRVRQVTTTVLIPTCVKVRDQSREELFEANTTVVVSNERQIKREELVVHRYF